MVFKYKGLLNDGSKTKGLIEAADLEDAKRRLRAKQIFYTSISEESAPLFGGISFKRRKSISSAALATLSRDLSIYLKAGISIVNALRLAQNQYAANKTLASFIATLITLLDEGKSFYQALDAQSIITLPDFYKQSIKVSENSGILQEVLLELSVFLKEQTRVNKQIQNAFAYPSFIIVVSLFMVAFMITFVVPKITGIFEQLGQELPDITKFVIALGDFFTHQWHIVAILLVALIVGFSLMMKLSAPFKYAVDLMMLKLPFFGPIIQSSELGRFSYISSVLIRSGIPFVQTANLAANIVKNSVIRKKFTDAAVRVVEGSKFSNALLRTGGYKIDSSFVQAIALGEETSEVSSILQNLSELYFEENKDKIALFLSLLEPALMLFVGGIIGFIVAAMLLPIFSMNIGA
ncbi:MAG: type II secretion system F family protein [Campylobacterales bacterium]|nr:type II secretion system F family protein [Campylobacterales bacterium]